MSNLKKFEVVRGYHLSTIRRARFEPSILGQGLFSAFVNSLENDVSDMVLHDLYKRLCNSEFQQKLIDWLANE